MEKHQYTKILTENTTNAYNKSNQKKISNISFTAKNITEKLSIDDRVQRMEELDSYITVKDHKDEFSHKIPMLLINLSKSNQGKSSKVILNKINQHLVTFTNINQWKNTQNLLNWFYKIQKKKKKNVAFKEFDIENFYPSITMELLYKSIQFPKEATSISDEDLDIIMQSRKTLLFHNQEPWVKREGDKDFDAMMGQKFAN